MFNYTVEIRENGVWRYEPRWERPFTDKKTLDESLDNGTMRLWLYGRKQRIEPFTPIRIKIYEVASDSMDVSKMTEEERALYFKGVIYRISGDSTVEQKRFAYNMPDVADVFLHTIQMLEPTKLLERDICDTLTFTNKLGRNYLDGAAKVKIIATHIHGQERTFSVDGSYMSPMAYESTEVVKSAKCLFAQGNMGISNSDWHITGGSITLIDPDEESEVVGTCKYESEDTGSFGTHYYYHYGVFTATKSIKFTKHGEYKIVYRMNVEKLGTNRASNYHEWTATITVIDGIIDPSYYTVTKVLKRILSAGVTRTKDAPQKYTLDPVIADKFKDVQSPEFYVSHGTMWESTSTVGGYVHGIPRLLWNDETDKPDIVTLDMLGEAVRKDITARMAAYAETIQADNYCDSINSVVENALNTRDRKQGTILDPCADGFKSVRCDASTVEISDNNAMITTALAIDTISKVFVKNTKTNETGEITPYLFEAAEYDGVLSEYTASYPYSKAWALRYEQGSNQITGLNFKIESVSSLAAAFQKPAIENILETVGVTVPSHYSDLAFQIEYVPYINMRVVQKKTYGAGKAGGTMFYNQGANRVESEVYGENMRGTVARLGNGEQMRTYYFYSYVDVESLRCGQIVDEMYISDIATEYEKEFIKCTLTLTPHFNRLAQYLGTFTEFRLYDVSERHCENRYINYGTDVILGAQERDGGLIPVDGKKEFVNTISPNTVSDNKQITCVYAWGSSESEDDDGNMTVENNTRVLLPCSSFALGNSLAFTFEYADNYSAGDKSAPSGESAKRIKQAVPYGNKYGEFQYLNLHYHSGADGVNSHDLPQVDSVPDSGAMLAYSGNKALNIEKDSRERLNVTVQLHIRANQKSVVIGTRLAQNNGLVTNAVDNEHRPVMYLLKQRLQEFNDFVDIVGARSVRYNLNVNDMVTDNYISFNADTSGYAAWAIIDPTENRLYVGKNLDDVVDGEEPNKLYISFLGGGQ